jgi:hypothetical protein
MAKHNQVPCPKGCRHPQGEHYLKAGTAINERNEAYACAECSCTLRPGDLTVARGIRYQRGVGWDYS